MSSKQEAEVLKAVKYLGRGSGCTLSDIVRYVKRQDAAPIGVLRKCLRRDGIALNWRPAERPCDGPARRPPRRTTSRRPARKPARPAVRPRRLRIQVCRSCGGKVVWILLCQKCRRMIDLEERRQSVEKERRKRRRG